MAKASRERAVHFGTGLVSFNGLLVWGRRRTLILGDLDAGGEVFGEEGDDLLG